MLDTIFMILGIIFAGLLVLILIGVALGIIKFGRVYEEDDEHADVGGSNG